MKLIYYNQSGVKYFSGYGSHVRSETYYTSDYDLSKFSSHFIGGSFRVLSADGLS